MIQQAPLSGRQAPLSGRRVALELLLRVLASAVVALLILGLLPALADMAS